MNAILLDTFGPAENLTLTDIPVPEIQPDEVLVEVKAISINPVDVKTRAGKGMAGRLKDQMPLILGWDISGVVAKAGNSVNEFKEGDEVFGMVKFPRHGKAYAQFVAVPASHLAKKPAEISHTEAAASTLAALTAWQVFNGKIRKGDRVLVHAASGGVGHFAVQIAKYFGAHVTGTSSAANRNFILGLGADEHIDYTAGPFEKAVNNIDFVLDAIGGEYIDRSLEVIKTGGTIVSIPSGLNETVTEKAKSRGINGYFMLVQSNGNDMKSLAELLQKKILIPHIAATFPFERMADAHRMLETGRTAGKIVITL
jgi:NADPH:quinone reductase-like Zn-dependent oxidoreductase